MHGEVVPKVTPARARAFHLQAEGQALRATRSSAVLVTGQSVDDRCDYPTDVGQRADDFAGAFIRAFEEGDEDMARSERPMADALSGDQHVLGHDAPRMRAEYAGGP